MKKIFVILLVILTLAFAYWCSRLASYENPEITGEVIWLQYCTRNWLKEVPVTVSVNGQTETIMVYMDFQVMVSRTDPNIPEGAGVGWNDNWCWQGQAEPVSCSP